MLELYYYPGNASLTPHMLLEELGVPFELKRVDRANAAHKSPDYLKLNPNGQIPVLVDGDLVLYETAAICLHLADTHPEARLVPPLATAERALWRYSPRRRLIRRSSIRNSASIANPTMPIAIIPLITIDVLMAACPFTSR